MCHLCLCNKQQKHPAQYFIQRIQQEKPEDCTDKTHKQNSVYHSTFVCSPQMFLYSFEDTFEGTTFGYSSSENFVVRVVRVEEERKLRRNCSMWVKLYILMLC